LIFEGFPIVDSLTQESWSRAMESGIDMLAVFMGAKKEDLVHATTVAKQYKGELIATWSTQKEIATRWGASGELIPTAIYIKQNAGGNSKFYIWNEETETELNADTLKAFVEGARTGTYKSFIKSEPIPEPNDGPVTIVVGKNFDSVVNQPKDVLIEFYAPWCGHCKKLAPIFDELGAAYKDDDSIVIAKIDATANGYPEDINVQGFPTLIFFTADNKQVEYNSGRDLESFKAFIEENRSQPAVAAAAAPPAKGGKKADDDDDDKDDKDDDKDDDRDEL